MGVHCINHIRKVKKHGELVPSFIGSREWFQFESHARAVVEECNGSTRTVSVRLVDFGFRLPNMAATAVKPLAVAFDGPPLAVRLHVDFLPKVRFVSPLVSALNKELRIGDCDCSPLHSLQTISCYFHFCCGRNIITILKQIKETKESSMSLPTPFLVRGNTGNGSGAPTACFGGHSQRREGALSVT